MEDGTWKMCTGHGSWRTIGCWGLLTLGLLLLTAAVTYPQATHFGTGVNDFGDPLLNSWALSWVAHAALHAPLSVFDANIFYPEHGTLALSENLLLPGLLVAPLEAGGFNPIVLHNVTLFSGFVLSGLTMFALVRALTQDWRAAVVASVIFCVYPLRIEHYPRVQLQLTYLMPLALLQVHRLWVGDTRPRTVAILGLSMAGLFACCVYYAVYFATVLPVVALVALATAPQRRIAAMARLAVAALVAIVLLVPLAVPYLRNHAEVGERQAGEVVRGSAVLADFGRSMPSNLLRGNPRDPGIGERRLFPGYSTLVLALTGTIAMPATALPYLVGAIVTADAALGVNGVSYPIMSAYLWVYKGLRVPARYAMLSGMFLAILAGLGTHRIMSRLPSPRLRTGLLIFFVSAATLEAMNRPLVLRDMPPHVPAVYTWLRSEPWGPVVEYPVGGLEGRIGPQDPTYMYYSTLHWRPLLNGYSGFSPASYTALLGHLTDFPSQQSIDYLRARGAMYLLVHEQYYITGSFEADAEALERLRGLRFVARFRDSTSAISDVYLLTAAGGGK